MPRKSKSGIGSTNPVPFGMSNKTMKRKKPINLDYIKKIEPLTENQELFFEEYNKDQQTVAYGCAGTGKTFITLYNALLDVLDTKTPYEKIYIVRSLVATREIGFLPGDHEDKSSLYQIPYKNMVKYMFEMPDDNAFEMLYANLKAQGTISFWSTSFIRGTTFDNAIIIVDEFQLGNAYPNPFNNKTSIDFYLPKEGNVELIIYNSKGYLVTKINKLFLSQGHKSLSWDGKNSLGMQVSAGLYFYQLNLSIDKNLEI